MPTERTYDVVLVGASGFAGELTAAYLARNAPTACRWAIAGRNRAKLAAVRDRLTATTSSCATLPVLHADISDPESLREIAEAARVVITTVGPYLQYGEPLVAACAAAGTDYVDLSGEPQFVDQMYLRHHDTAAATGARIVHACGFDSIPYDLGTYYTVRQLTGNGPVSVTATLRLRSTFSGGTYASMLTAVSRPREMRRAAQERNRTERRPANKTIRTPFGRPHRDPATGNWLVPMPTLDPQLVARSAAASDEYGTNFTYRQYVAFRHLPTLAALGAGLGTAILLSQVPPARRALGRLRAPGTGPSPAQRADSWFSVNFVGSANGNQVHTEFSGGDPGYEETAKMLGESALCLAFDELPATAGQVTSATAMGQALLERLRSAGLTIQRVAT